MIVVLKLSISPRLISMIQCKLDKRLNRNEYQVMNFIFNYTLLYVKKK